MSETITLQMDKNMTALKKNLTGLRTSRANPDMISNLMVMYYGTLVPLQQLASITVPENRVLMIQVFDSQAIADIEKAILTSQLHLNPQTEGGSIRLVLPELTEERRKELIKLAYKYGEDCKVSIRNTRRDLIDEIKKELKNKEVSEDESKRQQDEIQTVTDTYIKTIDTLTKAKETEILDI